MHKKICRRCKTEKPETEFAAHKSTPDKLQTWCKICKNERRKEARRAKEGAYATECERDRATGYVRHRRSYYKAKTIVLRHYGGENPKCKCGFTDLRALSIDHINVGGNQHRREIKGVNFYRWLVRNGLPDGFQILCMNCQFIKRYEENGYSVVADSSPPSTSRSVAP